MMFDDRNDEYILGIDPGAKGGLALLDKETGKIEETYSFDNFENAAEFVREGGIHKVCFLEKVHAMPQQGVSSTFKFGTNFGFWQGLLLGLGYEIELVGPQVWQSDLYLPKASSKTEHKNNLKQRASEFWPEIKFTHAIADAALIARYGFNTLSNSENSA